MADWTDLPVGFYAVPDPDDPGVITCWQRATNKGRHRFGPWRRGARYGEPAAPSRGVLGCWDAQWTALIVDAIAADPAGAAARFADCTTHCYICGRRLTHAVSKHRGIGPDCWAQLAVNP